MLSIVIPTLNAQAGLRRLLPQCSRADRVVVSDGGSSDHTIAVAIHHGARITLGALGRGSQLALGAQWHGGADWLLFLHADTRLPDGWHAVVTRHISRHPTQAGYFRYRADTPRFWGRIMELGVAMRGFLWRLPYGDQGLLISRDMYDDIGGYQALPLFEDVAIIDTIKARYGRTGLKALPCSIMTDVSAYERDGWLSRTWRNMGLMRRYRKGDTVDNLARDYT